jgi:hypothetical protein
VDAKGFLARQINPQIPDPAVAAARIITMCQDPTHAAQQSACMECNASFDHLVGARENVPTDTAIVARSSLKPCLNTRARACAHKTDARGS